MLGHYEFRVLPLTEQAQYIWNIGTCLATRTQKNYNFNLYHLHTFFAEVWYENDLNRIYKIRTFTSSGCLDDYADLIDITF